MLYYQSHCEIWYETFEVIFGGFQNGYFFSTLLTSALLLSNHFA
jgi:hypothetical protein